MTESIIVIRLSRNLRYKMTYIKIFETYLESGYQAEVLELLRSLLQSYQAAISPLASYLRRLNVAIQDLVLDDKLLAHAFSRRDAESQLRFIHDGLTRAALWYKTQLADRQMTTDSELQQLLLELGEMDAAKLWRTEAVMSALRIPIKSRELDEPISHAEPATSPVNSARDRDSSRTEEWRPRLVEDVRRPAWSGGGRPSTPYGRDASQSSERRRGPRSSGRGGRADDSGYSSRPTPSGRDASQPGSRTKETDPHKKERDE
jgi:hypothetical protein